jgi:endonuclease YncB( thermonuclease family)
MYLRSRFTRFLVTAAAALSLIAGGVSAPVSAASASPVSVSAAAGVSAKKKALSTEQKNAKKALDKAKKDLKTKEKNLKAAVKAQSRAAKVLAQASKSAEVAKVRNVVSASSKTKASVKALAKKLKTAQSKHKKATSLVARRTIQRDIAQAKVIRLNAKYAWLIEDISKLDCGVGTKVTTASGAVEVVRECGIVYKHEDGDTTHVKTTANKLVEVRNIGLQTPERKKGSNPAQCGADDAYENFKAMMPEEITIVQLRSISNSTNGWGGGSRPLRSVYKLNNTTGEFDIDVQAEQIRAGWSFWWPLAAEWAHNKEYLDLMNDAKARGVGIWNPNLCGSVTSGVPSMWFNANAPTIDKDYEPAFGEYVILKNETSAPINLSGWSLRDNSLNFFWNSSNGKWMQSLNKFGTFNLAPGEHRVIYLDNPKKYPLSTTEYEYFNWSRNTPGHQLTNGSVRTSSNPNYANGDGLYLLDPKGNIRNSMTDPCTSAAMCTAPAWVAEIISNTRPGQIIPIPVALNKVANKTRDLYNPVASIDPTKSFEQNKVMLEAKGFIVSNGVAVASTVASTHAAQITNLDGKVVTGTRVAIAGLSGRDRTTIYLHRGNDSIAVPNVANQAASAACAALVTARLTCAVTAGDENRLVATTTPLAGSLVQPNTAVTLNYVP